MATVDEIERKHEGGQLTANLFAGLPSVAAVLGPDHQSLDATYYDTDDLRLTRAGITFRRRTGDDSAGWHLKLPVGPEHRREVHAPLAAGPGEEAPAALTELVPVVTRGQRLSPVARIVTERDRWQLVGTDGAVLAEIADDNVRAHRMGEQDGPVEAWREAEIELVTGQRALLDAVSDRFTTAGMARSPAPSKLARVLGESADEGPSVEVDAKSFAADVLTVYLWEQVIAARRADIAFRLDDPAAVHDFRVAVRRLRSCLRVFRPMFQRKAIQPLTAELKWLSDLLGEARDVEVLRHRISDELDTLPAELILGPVPAQLDRQFAKPAATATTALRTALTQDRYLVLHRTLDDLLTTPPYRKVARQRARSVLPTRVHKAFRKARRSVEVADGQERRAARDVALHQVRKDVKRLRYACETVEPVIGKPAAKMRKRCKEIQGTLGDHHDDVVLLEVLRELGGRAHLDGGNGFTFGLLHGRGGVRARRAERVFARQWPRLAKPKVRRWTHG